ncbi:MAG: response regulator, partial [Deltaproteobacteria bacterium]|nr:response regulator [Deltaproteobacteria bacterium]
MRILIADDDLVSRRLLERTLVAMGHEVTAVGDGLAAETILLCADGPSIAILDWMMPGATGLEVCRLVRQRPAPYVYILLLTARDRREDIVTGLDAGADEFLTKPFDALELRARLRAGERVVNLQEGLIRAREDLRELAIHDSLTGLWNRGMILDQLG